jgi:hypothetical protein
MIDADEPCRVAMPCITVVDVEDPRRVGDTGVVVLVDEAPGMDSKRSMSSSLLIIFCFSASNILLRSVKAAAAMRS